MNNAFPQLAEVDRWLGEKGLKEPSDPNAVAGQQQLASGVGQFFMDRYGNTEALKKTIATDPVGTLGDAATVLTAGGAGLARAPGKLASVTSKGLLKAGNAVNPISAVTKSAGLLAGKPVAHLLGLTSGTGGDSVTEAFRAGERGGNYGKSFRDNMRGHEPQESVLQDARGALDKMHADRSAEYQQGMLATKANKATLDKQPIEDAMADLTDSLFHGPTAVTDDASLNLAKKVGQAIDDWWTHHPNMTAEDLDRLKVKIDKMKPNWTQESGDQSRIIGTMRTAIKNEILKKDPTYAKTMKAYEDSIGVQTDIEQALSLGGKASKDTTLRKLQSVMRNNVNTNYGSRKGNVKKLESAGADHIMPKLAGQAMSSLTPRGLSQIMAQGGLLGAAYLHDPTLIGGLLATSPRAVGELTHLLGRMKRKVPNAPLGLFQAGRVSAGGR